MDTSQDNYESYSNIIKDDVETLDKNLFINDFSYHIGSFPYMPKKFLGIDTKLFGETNPKLFNTGSGPSIHPFLQLKQKSFDHALDHNDRMQCVRYMCRIPYIDHIKHCIESVCDILNDGSINPYDKFYFFANNDKFMKLDDNIFYKTHEHFFYLAVKENYPLELILLSARYIIGNYHYEDDVRCDVLEFILDIADDKNETVYARSECADILANCGEGDEVFFGHKIIKELGDLFNTDKNKTFYTNAQNVHNETIEFSVRNIIRSLRKQFIKEINENKYTIENVHTDLDNYITGVYLRITSLSERHPDYEMKEKVKSFLYRMMTDPSKYERLSLADILLLVYNKIQTFDLSTRETCIQRLFEECLESLNTCSSGYLTRIINVLSGFVEGEEFTMRINPEEELKASIFARIESRIRGLPDVSRNDVLESLTQEDKSVFEEFFEIYSPEDELREEYKGILTDEKFKQVFENTLKIYKGEI